MTIFLNKLYKFDTLNLPGFKNEQDITKTRVAITIEKY